MSHYTVAVSVILSLISPKHEGWNVQPSFFENFLTVFNYRVITREAFLFSNLFLKQMATVIDLFGNFIFTADPWNGNIQNEMDARYVEQSSLTNLFTEHKFWGWAGLLLIFLAIAAIFYFQFQTWEQEDQKQEKLTPKQQEFVKFLEKASNQAKNKE